jgi:hypothetical protein
LAPCCPPHAITPLIAARERAGAGATVVARVSAVADFRMWESAESPRMAFRAMFKCAGCSRQRPLTRKVGVWSEPLERRPSASRETG